MKLTAITSTLAAAIRSNVPASAPAGARHLAPWENAIKNMIESGMTHGQIVSQMSAVEAGPGYEAPHESRINRAFTAGVLTGADSLTEGTLHQYLSVFCSFFNIKRRDKRIQQSVALVDSTLEVAQLRAKVAELESRLQVIQAEKASQKAKLLEAFKLVYASV